MSRPTTNRPMAYKFVLGGVLLLALAATAVASEHTFRKQLIERNDEKTWLITNMAKDKVMRPVFGNRLSLPDKCEYIHASELGTFGKDKKDFLPYNPTVCNETIVLVNWEAMASRDLEKLETLADGLFKAMEPPCARAQVSVWVQRTGKRELQAWVDLPRDDLMGSFLEEIMSLDVSKVSSYPSSMVFARPVRELAILTNDATVSKVFRGLPYTRLTTFNPAEVEDFRGLDDVSGKIIALNWNEELEVGPTVAAAVLPPNLAPVTAEQTPDRMGITPWQRFCRDAVAKCYDIDGTPTWLLRAPTARQLATLASVVCERELEGEGLKIPVCDLTGVESLAVGVYLMSDLSKERESLVIQEQLEERARTALGSHVPRLVSGVDWGPLLQETVGNDASALFGGGDSAERVVAASGADAVLLLWVRSLRPTITYDCNTTRMTERLPAFNTPEPREPNPNEKVLFGGHIYPGNNEAARRNSEKFQNACRSWRNEHSRWVQEQSNWEEQRRTRQVQYEHEIVSVSQVRLDGFLKVVDLTTKTALWTCDVSKTIAAPRVSVRRLAETVRGEATLPQGVQLPPNESVWTETTYPPAQEALVKSLEDGLQRLASMALWPSDLQEWSKAAPR